MIDTYVENCLFYGNRYRPGGANDHVGGGMFKYWGGGVLSNCRAHNCTVVDNEGYGLWDGENYNCIVVNNTYDAYVSKGNESRCNFYCRFTSKSAIQVGASIGASISGTGISYGKVIFADAAKHDYRLVEGSPCIDAGNNAYAEGKTDLADNDRVVNEKVDLGCYEYH